MRDSGKHRASQVTSRVEKVETKEQGEQNGEQQRDTSGRRHTVGCSRVEVSGWVGRSAAWP